VVFGHSIVYIGVGLLWLTFADDGKAVIREGNQTDGYQLAALLCFAMFTESVLRRIEGAGQTAVFGLSSGRWELILVFGVLSVALQLLFWSEVVRSTTHRSHG
jgi:hypothetical protein